MRSVNGLFRQFFNEELSAQWSNYNYYGHDSALTRHQLISLLIYFGQLPNTNSWVLDQQDLQLFGEQSAQPSAYSQNLLETNQKLALKLVRECRARAWARAVASAANNDYFPVVMNSHSPVLVEQRTVVIERHESTFWRDLFFLNWFMSSSSESHHHRHHHNSSSNNGNDDCGHVVVIFVLGVIVVVVLASLATIPVAALCKAGQDIADGKVARGTLVIGSTLAAGAVAGYLALGVLACAAIGPVGWGAIGAAGVILLSMAIMSLVSKWLYDGCSSQYQLTSKNRKNLSAKGEDLGEVEPILAELNQRRKQLGYTFPWNNNNGERRALEREITRLKYEGCGTEIPAVVTGSPVRQVTSPNGKSFSPEFFAPAHTPVAYAYHANGADDRRPVATAVEIRPGDDSAGAYVI